MLPLDHIPFQGPDLPAVVQAFAALGFVAAPPSFYTSPDEPQAHWENRCVFLERGWFDLLQAPGAPQAVRPGGVLFLTPDLDAAAARLKGLRRLPAYRLVRDWKDGRAQESFRLIAIRERISPLGLSIIEHASPRADAHPARSGHPNSAIGIAGVIFGGAQPGAFAEQAGGVLDLSGFQYQAAGAFEDVFGAETDCAVRISVASLAAVRSALASDLTVRESKGRLHVAPPSPLRCGFQFFEA